MRVKQYNCSLGHESARNSEVARARNSESYFQSNFYDPSIAFAGDMDFVRDSECPGCATSARRELTVFIIVDLVWHP